MTASPGEAPMEGHADQAGEQPQLRQWMARLEEKMDAVVEAHRQLRHWHSSAGREAEGAAQYSDATSSSEWRRELFARGSKSLMGAPLRVVEEQPPARQLSVEEEQPPMRPMRSERSEAGDRAGAAAESVPKVPRRSFSNISGMSMVSSKSGWSVASSFRSWSMRPTRGRSGLFGRRASDVSMDREDSEKSKQSRSSWRTARNALFLQRRNAHLEKQITRSSNRSADRISESSLSTKSSVNKETPERVKRIIKSTQFDMLVLIVIVANLFLIGAQVQHAAVSDAEVGSGLYTYAEYVCTLLFAVELFVRIAVLRREFFTNIDERWWNAFDAFLVVISSVDFCLNELTDTTLPGSSSFVSKFGRAIRIARIMRIIRTVRFLSPLRIMLSMIAGSMRSLFWILIILAGVIYSFSIVLTQGASDYLLHSSDTPADYAEVHFFFGSLIDTMYTLFQCISGGQSWGQVSVLMRGPGWFLEAIFVMYVFFVVIAVANIVNGVFVDGAIELAKRDRMTIIDKQKKDDQAKQTHLVHLLEEMDQDGDGRINFFEFCESLEREHVQEYISALQLDISDAKAFFALLDADGYGDLNIVDVVSGMMKLRGEARSVDVHMVLHQNAKLTKFVYGLAELVRERVGQEQKAGDGASRPPTSAAPSAAEPTLKQLSRQGEPPILRQLSPPEPALGI